MLREEEKEPKRRTRIMPMLAERQRWKERAAGVASATPAA
jgi:hypothetical protein